MSKRSLNILMGVIILGLIAGIIGYFVSPSFQGWVQTWLGNPVGLAATATTVAALATLLAVIVGLLGIRVGRTLAQDAYKQTEKALREGRRQFLETQFNARLPLLVPAVPDLSEQREAEEPMTFDWDATAFVTVQNVGTGLAANIWIAMLPPASSPDSGYQYASRLGSPLRAHSDPVKVYFRQGVTLFDESDSLNQYSLAIPPDRAIGATERADRYLARLSMTYQDIFGRKHASIFDLSDRGTWVNVAFLADIERDLGDIDATKVSSVVAVQADL